MGLAQEGKLCRSPTLMTARYGYGMKDQYKTRKVLIAENDDLRRRILELEQTSADEGNRRSERTRHRSSDSGSSYQALFRYSNDAILLTQPDGTILDANPAACEMFGRTLEEIRSLGRNGLVDRTDPRLHEALSDRARKFAARAEITMLRAGGDKFPAEITSAVFIDQNGQQKTSMIIRDITEKRRAEQDYRTFFRQMADGFVVQEILRDGEGMPRDYRIISVHPAFARMTGLQAEKIIGRTVVEVLPDSEWHWPETLGKVALSGKPAVFEHYQQLLDKYFVVTVFQPLPDQIACIFTDITDRKRAEEELHNHSTYNRSLIEANLDPLVTIDPSGKITDVNSATEQVTGYHRQEMIGTDFSDYFTEPEKARQVYQQVFKEGMVRDYPLEILHMDGRITLVLYNATVYHDGSGRIRGVFASARDVTGRKKAEEEKAKLEAVNRQLRKSASLGRMAGAIAHHFNNKLHVVMGHLELARVNLARGDMCSNNLNVAMTAADEAAEMSKMMLTYLGRVPGDQTLLDLAAICRTGLTVLQESMPKNVFLETDLQSVGPVVLANAKQLRQIFTNLVTNAWESAEENRALVIRLATRTVPVDAIPLAHRFPIAWQPEAGTYACLEVLDNGCGISETDLQELFAPFFSTKFTGRGLGLSMVLGLVQARSGVVTVESSLGRGSAFRVFLPVAAEGGAERAGDTTSAMAGRPAGKILLVDDDEIIVDITSMMLVRLGFTVLSAGDGIEAVEMYRQHRPGICLVLSDVYMPKMNGWETLSALRRIDPDIPVILISGYSEEQVMEGDHPDLPQAFLGKPYSFEVLKDAIRRALQDTSGYESYRGLLEQTGT